MKYGGNSLLNIEEVEVSEISLDYLRAEMIEYIRNQFRINWNGLHGANHWARVLHHGKYIGKRRNADLLVIELFAFLHDSCRWDDGRDPNHGERGAEFAYGMNGKFFKLNELQLDNLCFAIRHQSGGEISSNPTIQTCWDSDRLDLGRVGITPSPKFISDVASEMIDYAYDLSIK
jgi:uncharacterized protein